MAIIVVQSWVLEGVLDHLEEQIGRPLSGLLIVHEEGDPRHPCLVSSDSIEEAVELMRICVRLFDAQNVTNMTQLMNPEGGIQ